jgi:hypothetical protein
MAKLTPAAVEATPEPDPARVALAAAIANLDNADAAFYAARAAAQTVATARANLAAAEEALAEAKSAAGDAVASAATPTSDAPTFEQLREARRAHDDARDQCEAAEAGLVKLQAAVTEAERASDRARVHVANAAENVMRPAASRVLAEVEALQADLIRKRHALRHIMESRLLTDTAETVRAIALMTKQQWLPLLYEDMDPEQRRMQAEITAEWRSAVMALQYDPNAPVPA